MREGDKKSQEWTLTARWVLPVSGPPLEGGLVTVAGERIAAVEPHGSRRADLDLGDVAVIPGLVNAHTHLDLSGLRGLAPPSPDFTGWLRQVIAHRRTRTPEQTQADVRAGIAECLRYGTTLVGDIAAGGASWEALVESPLRAVVFHELLGVTEERARQAAAAGRSWLEAHPGTPTCRPGLSPHAPYSVRRDLFAAANELARGHGCPLMTHLAETRAECDLLEGRRGPFVPFLQEVGAWDPDGLVQGPTEALRICSQGKVKTLLAHCNYLSPADLPHAGTIVHCPRTHAAFRYSPHPLHLFRTRGVRLALGTDSLASNPDLDLLGEARFLHRYPWAPPAAALLRLATLAGAEALGWADETGSLEAGKSADLVVVSLPPAEDADPHQLVLGSDRPVERVLFRGRWVIGMP